MLREIMRSTAIMRQSSVPRTRRKLFTPARDRKIPGVQNDFICSIHAKGERLWQSDREKAKDTVTRDCEIQEALPLLTRRRDTCGLRDGAFGRFVGDSGG